MRGDSQIEREEFYQDKEISFSTCLRNKDFNKGQEILLVIFPRGFYSSNKNSHMTTQWYRLVTKATNSECSYTNNEKAHVFVAK